MKTITKSTRIKLEEHFNEFDSVLSDFLGEIIHLKNIIKKIDDDSIHKFCLGEKGTGYSIKINFSSRIISLKNILGKFNKTVNNEIMYEKRIKE